jgi:hypothetical protein
VSEIVLLYDTKKRQPGCVLLAAAFGTTGHEREFPSEAWLTFPTDDLRLYRVDRVTFDKLVADAQRRVRDGEFRKKP